MVLAERIPRVGVNAKGKKYVRGGVPGTGLYYQSSLPDAQPGQAPQSTSSVSPLAIIILLLVVGLIIYGLYSSKPTATSAPIAPVPHVVAPVAPPVAPPPIARKHKRKHAAHRAPAPAEEAPVAKPDVNGGADAQSPEN